MSSNAVETRAATSAPPRHLILGTAGHIDHGKTSLVKALTGTNTDRLPEEQARGMTIELGFAELTIGQWQFGVVDVPGHERFVRTMVAGATGIDLVLLIVAADDSVMPQTVEHVDILRLLGVQRGVVAITKADVVDAEMVELVCDDVRRLLADTPLANAELCPVSSITGQGIDELKAAIARAAEGFDARRRGNPFRLAVDRVFTVAGRGTVVTGSVLRGSVSAGDTLELFPANESCRVRDLQAHGAAQQQLTRGQRAALNLSGIDRDKIDRGSELATRGYLTLTRILDVRLECLRSFGKSLKSAAVARLSMGTREAPVRVVLFGADTLAPGDTTYAQLRSGEPLTAVHGQRFILRDETAARTIGGGVVLRPIARRRRRGHSGELDAIGILDSGPSEARLEQVLREGGFQAFADLELCARTGIELEELPAALDRLKQQSRWIEVGGTGAWSTPSAIDDLARDLTAWLRRWHERTPDTPGRPADAVVGWLERRAGRIVAKPLLETFIKRGALKRLGKFICLPEFAPTLSKADEKAMTLLITGMREGAFQPPALETVAQSAGVERKRMERLAVLAVALGELVRIDADIYLSTENERKLRETVAEMIHKQGGVTVAEVRESIHSSRKYAVPFMEYLDRIGFTRRVDDRRLLVDANT